MPGYENPEHSCDAIDNNCDGIVDNFFGNLTENQKGVCEGARQVCLNGTFVSVYTSLPNYESLETLCDGNDNDCDGFTDEPFNLTYPSVTYKGICAGRGYIIIIVLFAQE